MDGDGGEMRESKAGLRSVSGGPRSAEDGSGTGGGVAIGVCAGRGAGCMVGVSGEARGYRFAAPLPVGRARATAIGLNAENVGSRG